MTQYFKHMYIHVLPDIQYLISVQEKTGLVIWAAICLILFCICPVFLKAYSNTLWIGFVHLSIIILGPWETVWLCSPCFQGHEFVLKGWAGLGCSTGFRVPCSEKMPCSALIPALLVLCCQHARFWSGIATGAAHDSCMWACLQKGMINIMHP